MNHDDPLSELRGAGRLAADAVIGITELAESLHHAIATFGGVFCVPDGHRMNGISGMVYKNIRAVAGLTGYGVDAALAQLVPLFGKSESSPARTAVLSVLNGVLGDYLATSGNPLAIPMQLRFQGASLDLGDETFRESMRQSGGKVLLAVHGSCMNDLQWNREGHDHCAALAEDLGYLPVYLRYNTGLHVSQNGCELADLLETVFGGLPELSGLAIIAHSMGGLVSRSACHYGNTSGHTWPQYLKKLVCLGTPHHGAPLEQCGNLIDNILEINPYSAPFSRLGKIRSAGITDMRYGNLLHEDWKGRDRFELSGDHRCPVPLPENVQCYTIAATGNGPDSLGDYLIGDGLVPLDSALGRHDNPDLDLSFPESRQWIGRGINHMDLLNNSEVCRVLREWLKT